MIAHRNKRWTRYSNGMTVAQLAAFFNLGIHNAKRFNPMFNLAAIYDAFHNIKTLKKRKAWLYKLNTNENLIHNPIENKLDLIWEGYIKRLETQEQLKEEQYESGHIDWKLNKGFRE